MANFSGLWIGEFTKLEQLCLSSFIYYGHSFTLYVYDDSISVPTGVIKKNAEEIMPKKEIFYAKGQDNEIGKNSPAPSADLFRYRLLNTHDTIWSDCDMLCLSDDFDLTNDGYLFSIEPNTSTIAVDLLKLPVSSPALLDLISRAEAYPKDKITFAEIGPFLLSNIVDEHKLIDKAVPFELTHGFLNYEYLKFWSPEYKEEVLDKCNTTKIAALYNALITVSKFDKNNFPRGTAIEYFYNKFIKENTAMVEKPSSVFVQISSYHDYELSATILDAIEKSSGLNKINFGVHVIYHEDNDIYVPDLKNVKVAISKAPENLGMGIGRNIAHSFYSGEDYYVQVDSHTMFDKNWDEIFITDIKRYKEMGFKKPLLTSYPRNYWYDEQGLRKYDEGSENHVTYISFHENPDSFKNTRVPSQTAMANEVSQNVFSKSVSGGAIFTVGEFIEPNKNIFANGEEIFIAARAWTRGYDLLLPSRHVIYHLYYNHAAKGNNLHHEANNRQHVLKDLPNNRRLAWVDYQDLCANLDAISKKEIYDMFTKNMVGRYHLGSERTLQEFEMYSGLDFTSGKIIDRCI